MPYSREIFPTQGSNLRLFKSPAWVGRFFTTGATWETPTFHRPIIVLSTMRTQKHPSPVFEGPTVLLGI